MTTTQKNGSVLKKALNYLYAVGSIPIASISSKENVSQNETLSPQITSVLAPAQQKTMVPVGTSKLVPLLSDFSLLKTSVLEMERLTQTKFAALMLSYTTHKLARTEASFTHDHPEIELMILLHKECVTHVYEESIKTLKTAACPTQTNCFYTQIIPQAFNTLSTAATKYVYALSNRFQLMDRT